MLMFEVNITRKSPNSFLETVQVITRETKPPRVCRLLQFAKETNSEFEVNILETIPGQTSVKVLPLLSSKIYRELGVL